jgi:MazG family protein
MPQALDTTASTLTAAMEALGLEPHELQVFDPAYPRFDAQRPLLVLAAQFEAARPLLAERYPPTVDARAVMEAGAERVVAGELPSEASAWLLPALAPEEDVRGLAGLRGIVERLFSPEGCPWDQAQTPQSLATYFIEEAYELVDAIEREDAAEMREELGDILAHVFMQTSVAQQAGEFTVEDVVEYIARKLVRRHPHVYGDVDTDSPEEIERIWEEIKAAERAERDARDPGAARPESALDSVPNSAPSLVRVDKLIGRAERAGLGAPPTPARAELARALEAIAGTADEGPVGALLWAAVRVAREAEVDAEQALRLAANAFIERFREVEVEARASGLELSELPSERRAAAWPREPARAEADEAATGVGAQ